MYWLKIIILDYLITSFAFTIWSRYDCYFKFAKKEKKAESDDDLESMVEEFKKRQC